jgi:hypothetical protein
MREVSERAEEAYALMNTNARSPSPRGDIAQGPENALRLAKVLAAAGLPVSPSPA